MVHRLEIWCEHFTRSIIARYCLEISLQTQKISQISGWLNEHISLDPTVCFSSHLQDSKMCIWQIIYASLGKFQLVKFEISVERQENIPKYMVHYRIQMILSRCYYMIFLKTFPTVRWVHIRLMNCASFDEVLSANFRYHLKHKKIFPSLN